MSETAASGDAGEKDEMATTVLDTCPCGGYFHATGPDEHMVKVAHERFHIRHRDCLKWHEIQPEENR